MSFTDPDEPFKHVDMFLTDTLFYPALLPDAEMKTVGDVIFPVLSARRLLIVKKAIRPLRDKDRLDIMELERLLEEEDHQGKG